MADQIETTENNSLITLIAERQSFPRLKEPGPTEHQLKTVLQASMRAPDHMRLRPWRFLIIQKDGLTALDVARPAAFQASSIPNAKVVRLLVCSLPS